MRAHHRGGGLYTMAVIPRIGSYAAAAAARRGLHPSVLTLANLGLGVAAGAAVAVTAGTGAATATALAALVAWQAAYALDCADGQLARATGTGSAAGARLDVLVDLAVQAALVAGLATVAERASDPPAWLLGVFGTTWLVSLFTSVLAQGGAEGHSLLPSRSPVVQAVKLVRDYGVLVLVAALLAALLPGAMVWFLAASAALNGLFLLASIARAARVSRRPGG